MNVSRKSRQVRARDAGSVGFVQWRVVYGGVPSRSYWVFWLKYRNFKYGYVFCPHVAAAELK